MREAEGNWEGKMEGEEEGNGEGKMEGEEEGNGEGKMEGEEEMVKGWEEEERWEQLREMEGGREGGMG